MTSDIVIGTRGWYDMILPIRPGSSFSPSFNFPLSFPLIFFVGCREVSFTMNGFTNTETDPTSLPDARNFLHCGISGDPNLADSAASLINRFSYSLFLAICSFCLWMDLVFFFFFFFFFYQCRYKSGGGTFYISACFEEVTYLHCYPNNVVFQPGNGFFFLLK